MEPRINNILINRCLADGTFNDDGSYVYVSFVWEADENVTSVAFQWKGYDNDSEWVVKTISASGKSGTVEQIYGNGEIDPERRYNYAITITTSSTESIVPGIIKSAFYTMDGKTIGSGLSAGRTAEIEGLFDIEFTTRMLGGLVYPMLPYGTDLDSVTSPSTYASGHVGPEKYKNSPVANGTFILRVENSGDEDELMQTVVQCHKFAPKTFVRFYYNGSWGEWMHADNTETVLYENTSGSATTVTLSQSVTEFRYIDIYYTDNNGRGCGYTRIMNPNGKLAHLGLQEAAATTVFLRQTVYTISDKTLTPNVEAASIVRITTTNGAVPTMGTNYIRIVRVVGRA